MFNRNKNISITKLLIIIAIIIFIIFNIKGLNPETPVKDIEDNLINNNNNITVLKSDRNCVVKLRRHQHVVPGIKLFKNIKIDGNSVKVYSSLV